MDAGLGLSELPTFGTCIWAPMFESAYAVCRWAGVRGAWYLCGCALLLGLAGTTASAAGVALDSLGFEAPTFTPGNLHGQPASSPFKWLASGDGATSATVQSSIKHSGNQAVLVTRTADSDKRFGVPGLAGLPSQRYIIIDWDMNVSQATTGGGFGPYFGVDSYDDDGTFAQLGTFGVDASTAELLYQQGGSGAIIPVAGPTVPFDTWHHYRVVLDFATDTYQGYYDGVQKFSTAFIDVGLNPDDFSDADIMAIAAAPDSTSQDLSASAVFDNFIIRDGLLGDYNLDGVVNNADYTTWRSTMGSVVGVPGNNADGNKNGVVDAADYVIWRDHFGDTLAGSAAAGAGFLGLAVPEPAGVVLSILAAPALLFRARRRRIC